MKSRPVPIAVYDLDRTVTFRPTYSLFLLRSAARLAPARLLMAPFVLLAMLGHGLGLCSRDALKSLMWALMLGPVDPVRLNRAIGAFVEWNLRSNIRPGARRQIERDREAGAFLVLATAAHELYAQPIAAALGFDAVVATRAAVRADGRIGPALAGGNIYGSAKLEALRAFIEARVGTASTIAFYTDSASDRFLLQRVDHPVAVNPSRRLARLAADLGWPTVDWKRP